jgi:hypothetical protein
MKALHPLPKRDMRPLHNSTNHYRELLPATITLNKAISDILTPCCYSGYVLTLAVRASDSFAPSDVLKNLPGLIFG